MAAHQIILGGADAAIGGGVESITMMKRDGDPNPWVKEKKPGIYMVMGDTAEVVAKRYNITRQMQDEYSLVSQQRTARAQQDGFFKEELAPLQVVRGIVDKKTGEIVGKEDYYVDKDECNRPDTTLEGLLALPPHFDKTSGQGTRHRRQLVAALGRRLGDPAHVHGPRQGARRQAQADLPRLRRRRVRARRDGHRADLRGAEAPQAERTQGGRHRRVGAERGLRRRRSSTAATSSASPWTSSIRTAARSPSAIPSA